MIENYTRLSSRIFTATVVGKDQKGRKITEGVETYKTPSGVYEIKDWARHVEKAAEADGLLPLLEQIKQHVKEYAWMKNASDINVLILAAECLTGHAYEHWEGFTVDGITKQTRRKSYDGIRTRSGERCKLILETLGNRSMTVEEITDELVAAGHLKYYDRNFVAPRLTELKGAGVLEVVGKKPSKRTGKNTAVWAAVRR